MRSAYSSVEFKHGNAWQEPYCFKTGHMVKYLYVYRKSLAGPEVERFKVLVISVIALASLSFDLYKRRMIL